MNTKCPICDSVDGGSFSYQQPDPSQITFSCQCEICGNYEINNIAWDWLVEKTEEGGFSKTQRALLSHKIQEKNRTGRRDIVTKNWLKNIISLGELPTPAMQAANMVRFVGDSVSKSGHDLSELPQNLHTHIGAPSQSAAIKLAWELEERGILRFASGALAKATNKYHKYFFRPSNISLTLDGWQEYEDGKRGHISENYGFLAMKFNDSHLEAMVQGMKCAIKENLGYALHDMREVSEAGIIDNIMREKIRGAKFIIADLSHDNPGAYFEAGYAEGLNKPVIYICEKEKFEDKNKGTHFDTNHCTTVPWPKGVSDNFYKELIATLRRSLDQV